jgi:hypothetical protein
MRMQVKHWPFFLIYRSNSDWFNTF